MAGKIFINYRRDDAPGDARSLRDGLVAKFGRANVFMDVDDLLVGQRFDQELAKALGVCDILIAVVGPRWLELLQARSADGDRDYVREEIAEALRRKIVVIPVRVGREGHLHTLPRLEDLPADIREFALYQKHDVVHERFARDIAELLSAIATLRKLRPLGQRTARVVSQKWLPASAIAAVLAVAVGSYTGALALPALWEAVLASIKSYSGDNATSTSVRTARAEAFEAVRLAAVRSGAETERMRKAEAEARAQAAQAAAAVAAASAAPAAEQYASPAAVAAPYTVQDLSVSAPPAARSAAAPSANWKMRSLNEPAAAPAKPAVPTPAEQFKMHRVDEYQVTAPAAKPAVPAIIPTFKMYSVDDYLPNRAAANPAYAAPTQELPLLLQIQRQNERNRAVNERGEPVPQVAPKRNRPAEGLNGG